MIQTYWYDEAKTIIVHDHPDSWTVDDFVAARAVSIAWIADSPHPVDLILHKPGIPLSFTFIPQAFKTFDMYPPTTRFIVVDRHREVWHIVQMFLKMYPHTEKRVKFALTMDEAVAIANTPFHTPGTAAINS